MPATAAGKLSQGELAEAALVDYAGAPPHPLIDIGANLADPSFDQALPLAPTMPFLSACSPKSRFSIQACKNSVNVLHAHGKRVIQWAPCVRLILCHVMSINGHHAHGHTITSISHPLCRTAMRCSSALCGRGWRPS